ncbi:hypothetical protein FNF27_02449 [Cafeteria roenbergensis]|uniref:Uncharacterized protein n=2 Tax=Cafeteria roenbergensis TaxID=33653 RepID=A0A5A8EH81_CAFRO|nr:hypothetical protein FNF27_02449 [Cafeteria roenbergensis]
MQVMRSGGRSRSDGRGEVPRRAAARPASPGGSAGAAIRHAREEVAAGSESSEGRRPITESKSFLRRKDLGRTIQGPFKRQNVAKATEATRIIAAGLYGPKLVSDYEFENHGPVPVPSTDEERARAHALEAARAAAAGRSDRGGHYPTPASVRAAAAARLKEAEGDIGEPRGGSRRPEDEEERRRRHERRREREEEEDRRRRQRRREEEAADAEARARGEPLPSRRRRDEEDKARRRRRDRRRQEEDEDEARRERYRREEDAADAEARARGEDPPSRRQRDEDDEARRRRRARRRREEDEDEERRQRHRRRREAEEDAAYAASAAAGGGDDGGARSKRAPSPIEFDRATPRGGAVGSASQPVLAVDGGLTHSHAGPDGGAITVSGAHSGAVGSAGGGALGARIPSMGSVGALGPPRSSSVSRSTLAPGPPEPLPEELVQKAAAASEHIKDHRRRVDAARARARRLEEAAAEGGTPTDPLAQDAVDSAAREAGAKIAKAETLRKLADSSPASASAAQRLVEAEEEAAAASKALEAAVDAAEGAGEASAVAGDIAMQRMQLDALQERLRSLPAADGRGARAGGRDGRPRTARVDRASEALRRAEKALRSVQECASGAGGRPNLAELREAVRLLGPAVSDARNAVTHRERAAARTRVSRALAALQEVDEDYGVAQRTLSAAEAMRNALADVAPVAGGMDMVPGVDLRAPEERAADAVRRLGGVRTAKAAMDKAAKDQAAARRAAVALEAFASGAGRSGSRARRIRRGRGGGGSSAADDGDGDDDSVEGRGSGADDDGGAAGDAADALLADLAKSTERFRASCVVARDLATDAHGLLEEEVMEICQDLDMIRGEVDGQAREMARSASGRGGGGGGRDAEKAVSQAAQEALDACDAARRELGRSQSEAPPGNAERARQAHAELAAAARSLGAGRRAADTAAEAADSKRAEAALADVESSLRGHEGPGEALRLLAAAVADAGADEAEAADTELMATVRGEHAKAERAAKQAERAIEEARRAGPAAEKHALALEASRAVEVARRVAEDAQAKVAEFRAAAALGRKVNDVDVGLMNGERTSSRLNKLLAAARALLEQASEERRSALRAKAAVAGAGGRRGGAASAAAMSPGGPGSASASAAAAAAGSADGAPGGGVPVPGTFSRTADALGRADGALEVLTGELKSLRRLRERVGGLELTSAEHQPSLLRYTEQGKRCADMQASTEAACHDAVRAAAADAKEDLSQIRAAEGSLRRWENESASSAGRPTTAAVVAALDRANETLANADVVSRVGGSDESGAEAQAAALPKLARAAKQARQALRDALSAAAYATDKRTREQSRKDLAAASGSVVQAMERLKSLVDRAAAVEGRDPDSHAAAGVGGAMAEVASKERRLRAAIQRAQEADEDDPRYDDRARDAVAGVPALVASLDEAEAAVEDAESRADRQERERKRADAGKRAAQAFKRKAASADALMGRLTELEKEHREDGAPDDAAGKAIAAARSATAELRAITAAPPSMAAVDDVAVAAAQAAAQRLEGALALAEAAMGEAEASIAGRHLTAARGEYESLRDRVAALGDDVSAFRQQTKDSGGDADAAAEPLLEELTAAKGALEQLRAAEEAARREPSARERQRAAAAVVRRDAPEAKARVEAAIQACETMREGARLGQRVAAADKVIHSAQRELAVLKGHVRTAQASDMAVVEAASETERDHVRDAHPRPTTPQPVRDLEAALEGAATERAALLAGGLTDPAQRSRVREYLAHSDDIGEMVGRAQTASTGLVESALAGSVSTLEALKSRLRALHARDAMERPAGTDESANTPVSAALGRATEALSGSDLLVKMAQRAGAEGKARMLPRVDRVVQTARAALRAASAALTARTMERDRAASESQLADAQRKLKQARGRLDEATRRGARLEASDPEAAEAAGVGKARAQAEGALRLLEDAASQVQASATGSKQRSDAAQRLVAGLPDALEAVLASETAATQGEEAKQRREEEEARKRRAASKRRRVEEASETVASLQGKLDELQARERAAAAGRRDFVSAREAAGQDSQAASAAAAAGAAESAAGIAELERAIAAAKAALRSAEEEEAAAASEGRAGGELPDDAVARVTEAVEAARQASKQAVAAQTDGDLKLLEAQVAAAEQDAEEARRRHKKLRELGEGEASADSVLVPASHELERAEDLVARLRARRAEVVSEPDPERRRELAAEGAEGAAQALKRLQKGQRRLSDLATAATTGKVVAGTDAALERAGKRVGELRAALKAAGISGEGSSAAPPPDMERLARAVRNVTELREGLEHASLSDPAKQPAFERYGEARAELERAQRAAEKAVTAALGDAGKAAQAEVERLAPELDNLASEAEEVTIDGVDDGDDASSVGGAGAGRGADAVRHDKDSVRAGHAAVQGTRGELERVLGELKAVQDEEAADAAVPDDLMPEQERAARAFERAERLTELAPKARTLTSRLRQEQASLADAVRLRKAAKEGKRLAAESTAMEERVLAAEDRLAGLLPRVEAAEATAAEAGVEVDGDARRKLASLKDLLAEMADAMDRVKAASSPESRAAAQRAVLRSGEGLEGAVRGAIDAVTAVEAAAARGKEAKARADADAAIVALVREAESLFLGAKSNVEEGRALHEKAGRPGDGASAALGSADGALGTAAAARALVLDAALSALRDRERAMASRLEAEAKAKASKAAGALRAAREDVDRCSGFKRKVSVLEAEAIGRSDACESAGLEPGAGTKEADERLQAAQALQAEAEAAREAVAAGLALDPASPEGAEWAGKEENAAKLARLAAAVKKLEAAVAAAEKASVNAEADSGRRVAAKLASDATAALATLSALEQRQHDLRLRAKDLVEEAAADVRGSGADSGLSSARRRRPSAKGRRARLAAAADAASEQSAAAVAEAVAVQPRIAGEGGVPARPPSSGGPLTPGFSPAAAAPPRDGTGSPQSRPGRRAVVPRRQSTVAAAFGLAEGSPLAQDRDRAARFVAKVAAAEHAVGDTAKAVETAEAAVSAGRERALAEATVDAIAALARARARFGLLRAPSDKERADFAKEVCALPDVPPEVVDEFQGAPSRGLGAELASANSALPAPVLDVGSAELTTSSMPLPQAFEKVSAALSEADALAAEAKASSSSASGGGRSELAEPEWGFGPGGSSQGGRGSSSLTARARDSRQAAARRLVLCVAPLEAQVGAVAEALQGARDRSSRSADAAEAARMRAVRGDADRRLAAVSSRMTSVAADFNKLMSAGAASAGGRSSGEGAEDALEMTAGGETMSSTAARGFNSLAAASKLNSALGTAREAVAEARTHKQVLDSTVGPVVPGPAEAGGAAGAGDGESRDAPASLVLPYLRSVEAAEAAVGKAEEAVESQDEQLKAAGARRVLRRLGEALGRLRQAKRVIAAAGKRVRALRAQSTAKEAARSRRRASLRAGTSVMSGAGMPGAGGVGTRQEDLETLGPANRALRAAETAAEEASSLRDVLLGAPEVEAALRLSHTGASGAGAGASTAAADASAAGAGAGAGAGAAESKDADDGDEDPDAVSESGAGDITSKDFKAAIEAAVPPVFSAEVSRLVRTLHGQRVPAVEDAASALKKAAAAAAAALERRLAARADEELSDAAASLSRSDAAVQRAHEELQLAEAELQAEEGARRIKEKEEAASGAGAAAAASSGAGAGGSGAPTSPLRAGHTARGKALLPALEAARRAVQEGRGAVAEATARRDMVGNWAGGAESGLGSGSRRSSDHAARGGGPVSVGAVRGSDSSPDRSPWTGALSVGGSLSSTGPLSASARGGGASAGAGRFVPRSNCPPAIKAKFLGSVAEARGCANAATKAVMSLQRARRRVAPLLEAEQLIGELDTRAQAAAAAVEESGAAPSKPAMQRANAAVGKATGSVAGGRAVLTELVESQREVARRNAAAAEAAAAAQAAQRAAEPGSAATPSKAEDEAEARAEAEESAAMEQALARQLQEAMQTARTDVEAAEAAVKELRAGLAEGLRDLVAKEGALAARLAGLRGRLDRAQRDLDHAIESAGEDVVSGRAAAAAGPSSAAGKARAAYIAAQRSTGTAADAMASASAERDRMDGTTDPDRRAAAAMGFDSAVGAAATSLAEAEAAVKAFRAAAAAARNKDRSAAEALLAQERDAGKRLAQSQGRLEMLRADVSDDEATFPPNSAPHHRVTAAMDDAEAAIKRAEQKQEAVRVSADQANRRKVAAAAASAARTARGSIVPEDDGIVMLPGGEEAIDTDSLHKLVLDVAAAMNKVSRAAKVRDELRQQVRTSAAVGRATSGAVDGEEGADGAKGAQSAGEQRAAVARAGGKKQAVDVPRAEAAKGSKSLVNALTDPPMRTRDGGQATAGLGGAASGSGEENEDGPGGFEHSRRLRALLETEELRGARLGGDDDDEEISETGETRTRRQILLARRRLSHTAQRMGGEAGIQEEYLDVLDRMRLMLLNYGRLLREIADRRMTVLPKEVAKPLGAAMKAATSGTRKAQAALPAPSARLRLTRLQLEALESVVRDSSLKVLLFQSAMTEAERRVNQAYRTAFVSGAGKGLPRAASGVPAATSGRPQAPARPEGDPTRALKGARAGHAVSFADGAGAAGRYTGRSSAVGPTAQGSSDSLLTMRAQQHAQAHRPTAASSTRAWGRPTEAMAPGMMPGGPPSMSVRMFTPFPGFMPVPEGSSVALDKDRRPIAQNPATGQWYHLHPMAAPTSGSSHRRPASGGSRRSRSKSKKRSEARGGGSKPLYGAAGQDDQKAVFRVRTRKGGDGKRD